MLKTTLLYGHPEDMEAFENYYATTHLPIASKMKGVVKMEFTKFVSAVDGSKAPYYRMAELYFPGMEEMQETMASPEGQAAVGDLPNFATGGVTVIIGTVES
jgi:uncharacterized protein (TIGR02118 family)